MANNNRIKGITIEIGGDTTKLQTALRGVNTDIKSTQSQLKDVNKLLKLDPGNTELLAQRHRMLGDAVSETKDKLETLKTAAEQANAALAKGDISQSQYDSLQREIVETTQNLKELEKQAAQSGEAVQSIAAKGEKLKAAGDAIKGAGEAMLPVTGAITAVGGVAAAKFADVDKIMTLTNETMGNTEAQAKLLEDAMSSAAANSTFGMSDAANAALNFARAGLTAEQAAATLAPAMNLAAGEGGNLDTVSAGLVGTINGFGDSFDNAGHYADVFAAACNNSALDVNALSDAMSIAAPVFKAAGYSIDDAALYMGVMANNGIDANTAANALKTGVARLASPAKEGSKWIERLGLEIFNADGTMKDSVTVQQQLHNAFAGLSEQEQIAAASAIFGKNQMSNWLALINTAPADVQQLSDSLSQAAGITNEMAAAMMDGFGGSIEQLKSTVDVLMVSVGKLIAEFLLPIVKKLTEVLTWLNSLDDGTKRIIITIAAVVAAIGPLLIIIGTLLSSIGQIMVWAPAIAGAITTLKGTMLPALAASIKSLWALLMANPIVLVIAAVAALVAAFVHFWRTSEEFRSAVLRIFEEIKNFGRGVAEAVSGALTAAGNFIQSIVQAATTWGSDLITNFINGILSRVNALWSTVSGIAQGIRDYIGFSEPEEGPLSNFHTYAPDMMRLFAQGIRENEALVQGQLARAFTPPDMGEMQLAGATATAGSAPAVIPTGLASGQPRMQTAILQVDRTPFAKLVYELNDEETQRIGVKLTGR